MRFVSTIVLFLAIAVASDVRAQGEFVARGAYGVLVGGELIPQNDRTSYAATAGFSFKGTLDARLGYGWLETGADTLGGTLSGRSIRPGLNVHIIKQGNTYPFSLSAVGSYQWSNWDAEMIGAEDADGSEYSVGGVLHTIVQVAEFAGLRPWFGIIYQNQDREYTFADQARITIERDDTKYLGGLQVVLMPTVRTVLFVGPTVTFLRGEQDVGVSGGLVFN